MFNNLIESSSHTREFKRRGSFFLFTTATYFLLFVIAGVASIYAYDARLDDLNRESITMLSPRDLAEPPAAVIRNVPPPRGGSSQPTETVRQVAMASVNVPLARLTTDPEPVRKPLYVPAAVWLMVRVPFVPSWISPAPWLTKATDPTGAPDGTRRKEPSTLRQETT